MMMRTLSVLRTHLVAAYKDLNAAALGVALRVSKGGGEGGGGRGGQGARITKEPSVPDDTKDATALRVALRTQALDIDNEGFK